jgi:hypothetical protein
MHSALALYTIGDGLAVEAPIEATLPATERRKADPR